MNISIRELLIIFSICFASCSTNDDGDRLRRSGWLENPLLGDVKTISTQSLEYERQFGEWVAIEPQMHYCRQEDFDGNGELISVEDYIGDSASKSNMYSREMYFYDSIGRLDRIILYTAEGKESSAQKIYTWDSIGRPLTGTVGNLFHFDSGYPCKTCGDEISYRYMGASLASYTDGKYIHYNIERGNRGLVVKQEIKEIKYFVNQRKFKHAYRYIQFDGSGNWTERIQYSLNDLLSDTSLIQNALIEKRQVSYY